MTRAKDEQSYMEEACGILIKDGGYRMAWVGYAEENENKSITPVAHAGFNDGYLDTVNVSWADVECGHGPTGTAVRTGQAAICRNMQEDPKLKPWRERAIKRGYASSIGLPLKDSGEAFGALTIYSTNPDPFTDDEVKLLTEFADDLAYGITAIRLREAHAHVEEVLRRDKETLEKLVNEQANQMVKAQLEVEKSKRLSDIGQLASTIAHELRNPLVAIKMAAYNIKRKAANPNLDKHIENINKKVAESDLIIQNVLNFSKTKIPKFEHVNLCDIIKENLATVSSKYKDWNVELKEKYECEAGGPIEADPAQMAAIFSNILDNAYQALPDKAGSIDISVLQEGGADYVVRVKDSGLGISEENLAKIFDPFFTTKARGTGLGLTVCKELIALHGGKLEIGSKLGEGTTVTITLPKKH
jgi:signal transduction histidine kinase